MLEFLKSSLNLKIIITNQTFIIDDWQIMNYVWKIQN